MFILLTRLLFGLSFISAPTRGSLSERSVHVLIPSISHARIIPLVCIHYVLYRLK